jgi:hypothetical protein
MYVRYIHGLRFSDFIQILALRSPGWSLIYDLAFREQEAYNVGFPTIRHTVQWSSLSLILGGGGLKALALITAHCKIYIRTPKPSTRTLTMKMTPALFAETLEIFYHSA